MASIDINIILRTILYCNSGAAIQNYLEGRKKIDKEDIVSEGRHHGWRQGEKFSI